MVLSIIIAADAQSIVSGASDGRRICYIFNTIDINRYIGAVLNKGHMAPAVLCNLGGASHLCAHRIAGFYGSITATKHIKQEARLCTGHAGS